MNVLIIKTSSLGDIVHMLPAITDASRHNPDIRFDWVVEESFAELPALHPSVAQVIPVAFRRWRKHPWQARRSGEWQRFKQQLQSKQYDRVIDSQGLLKSAFIGLFARGERCGLDWYSVWEKLASVTYQRRVRVEPEQHAVVRMRQLLAQIFNYSIETKPLDYGIHLDIQAGSKNTIVFLHGTSWETKKWPAEYWIELAHLVPKNFSIVLPWGNKQEHNVAQAIAAKTINTKILPRMTLLELAHVLACAKAVVSVDTGLGHLATALNTPTLGLYGATDANLTGTYSDGDQQHIVAGFPSCVPCLKDVCRYRGERKTQLEPPCMASITAQQVGSHLLRLLS